MARQIGLRRLTGSPQTRGQLAAAMARRGVPPQAADVVLDRFEEVGLVDDRAYAQAWVQSRHRGRGLARRALAEELRRRGVDRDVVEETIQGLEPGQELETARALVRSRLPATARLRPEVRLRRLVGVLARRGYPQGMALSVVRQALAETQDQRAGDRPDRDRPDRDRPAE